MRNKPKSMKRRRKRKIKAVNSLDTEGSGALGLGYFPGELEKKVTQRNRDRNGSTNAKKSKKKSRITTKAETGRGGGGRRESWDKGGKEMRRKVPSN